MPLDDDADRYTIDDFLAEGDFHGRRVTLVDPDDLTGRTRNVYEDLDRCDDGCRDRKALLTLYPEHPKAKAKGDDDSGQVVLTHAEALADMQRMIQRFGYVVQSIERDIH